MKAGFFRFFSFFNEWHISPSCCFLIIRWKEIMTSDYFRLGPESFILFKESSTVHITSVIKKSATLTSL